MTISGIYAYRFSGFAVVEGIPCTVVGLGNMTIGADGSITGFQTSSATQLQGDGAEIEVATFSLKGTFAPKSGGGPNYYEATLDFHLTGGNGNGPSKQNLTGTFSIVAAGGIADPGERLWLISTGATTNGSDADEVVSGEAIRIAAPA